MWQNVLCLFVAKYFVANNIVKNVSKTLEKNLLEKSTHKRVRENRKSTKQANAATGLFRPTSS